MYKKSLPLKIIESNTIDIQMVSAVFVVLCVEDIGSKAYLASDSDRCERASKKANEPTTTKTSCELGECIFSLLSTTHSESLSFLFTRKVVLLCETVTKRYSDLKMQVVRFWRDEKRLAS